MDKSKYLIYLAGPITGESYDGCTDWREWASIRFANKGMVGLSPMRHKEYLLEETTVADEYTDKIMSCQRGIFARDSFDCKRADLVLANLLDASRVSIGTVMEISWAWQNRIPIVLVMEEGNLHDHAMIREACPFRVDTIDEAIDVASRILLP